MKKILYISPGYGLKGVMYKHNRRFINAIKDHYEIVVASCYVCDNLLEGDLEYLYSNRFLTKFYYKLFYPIKKRLTSNMMFVIPDEAKCAINPSLLRKCREYIKNNKVDCIVTVSWPLSSTLLGYVLKKEFGIPWIAHFFDAWIDNPYRKVPAHAIKKDRDYERLVAINADAIFQTNTVLLNIWNKRYGDILLNKQFVMPFCYDVTQIKNHDIEISRSKKTSNKLQITYIGTTVGNRNFQTLIKSVSGLKQTVCNLEDKLLIRVVGNLLPIDENSIRFFHLENIFENTGYVPGDRLWQYYIDTDIFLVIDADMNENIFFPSKLLDYFYYQKPILGITPKIGVTHDLLTESNNFSFECNDVRGISVFLSEILMNPELLNKNAKEYYKQFSPDVVLEKFDIAISSVLKDSHE